MTAALVVLAACFLWVSALCTFALTRQLDQDRDRRKDVVAAVVTQHDETMGLLAEELTANRKAYEQTLRMVLAGYERLVYPASVPDQPIGPTPGEWPEWKDYGERTMGARPRPAMPDDPAVSGDFSEVAPEEPAFLGMPFDDIPEDALHSARVEAMYSAPVEPMPEAASPHGAVFMDVDDPDPFGIGVDRDRLTEQRGMTVDDE